MLRQEDIAFLKALSCAQPSLALLKELRKAVANVGKKKRPAVSTGSRSTLGGASTASHRSSTNAVGKRKVNELTGSGDSTEPATRRPAPGDGSAPLPAMTTRATGEQAASGGRQLGSSESGAAPAAQHKPSGPLKPTAKGSNPSEPAVSSETAPRRMPLSGMPVGTTVDAHVANPCLPAGERPNKTPIFISGVGDTRAFLAWLRSSCPCDLTAQLKADKLMVVPSTADGFRATICALRSLDRGKGVNFHTFSLPEDRCVRLLMKNLGKGMPESTVREELESLNIHVQGVMQLRSGRRDQDPAKDRPPTPTSLCLWHGVRRCPECALSPSSAVCGLRWRHTWR